MINYKVVLLSGDGIGPEVMNETLSFDVIRGSRVWFVRVSERG